MKRDIIINVASQETRIAIMEDDQLTEILIERPENERIVGNIYKGTVTSVLPGMQAAFVDIGTSKAAFLHVSDVDYNDMEDLIDPETDADNSGPSRGRHRRREYRPIQHLLKRGQDILVQVTKEPISTKGPRVTSQLSLPGRFSVLMPGGTLMGVSRKIPSMNEKRRLRNLARGLKPEGCGLIVRTVADGKGEDELTRDIKLLTGTWDRIRRRAKRINPPALLHAELGMTSGLIRDLFSDDVDKVVIDSKSDYKDVLNYLRDTAPHLRERVELYNEDEPVFDHFKIESEIEKATNRRVPLPQGGVLIIDHTEAMVTIDVNSGRYVGHANQEATIFNVNMIAATEVARQLRLRDIGGIIVIDFIDMMILSNRRKLWAAFSQAIKRDRARTNVAQEISEFGLIEMTRQRVRPSLLYTFSDPCPTCKGHGRVEGVDTTVTKVERWLKRAMAKGCERRLLLDVHPRVADYLQENHQRRLKALRRSTRVRVDVDADPEIAPDAFHFYSASTEEELTEEHRG